MTAATPTPQLPPCQLCQGQQVGDLDLTSQYAVGVHPGGRSLWKRPLSGLTAVVCLNCGHTTFRVAELARVRDEAERHPDRFSW